MKRLTIMGIIFTFVGMAYLWKGDITNGFLAMILGELVDLPERLKK